MIIKQKTKAPFSMEEEAYKKIKALIFSGLFSGTMVAGQKLIYRDLERELGMSKTPIIAALARLAQEGMVTLEHNRGYFIRKLEINEVVQLYEIRIKMEEIAVDYAIKNGDRKGLQKLKHYLDSYVSYDLQAYDTHRLHLDLNFHLHIAEMGGNHYLVSLLKQIYDQTCAGLVASFMSPLIPKFITDHQLLYEAIVNKDTETAKTLTRKHEERTLKILVP